MMGTTSKTRTSSKNNAPAIGSNAANRIAQQHAVKTLVQHFPTAQTLKSLGITRAQYQTAMRQVCGYLPPSVSIPVSLTGVTRYNADGSQNYGRPQNSATAPSKSKSASNGRKTASKTASKSNGRKRPTVAARNRSAKHGPSDAARRESASLLAGVSTTSDSKV